MKRLDSYLTGTTILAAIGCSLLWGKISRLETKIDELTKTFQMTQIQRPASYFGASNRDNIFKIDLDVLEEFKTVPANSQIMPPLIGYSYFCTTPDNVGYYVFTRTSLLREGDKIKGWFNSTGLIIHNDKYDKNFPLISPVYIENLELQNKSTLRIQP